jgi:hypothetical protein
METVSFMKSLRNYHPNNHIQQRKIDTQRKTSNDGNLFSFDNKKPLKNERIILGIEGFFGKLAILNAKSNVN